MTEQSKDILAKLEALSEGNRAEILRHITRMERLNAHGYNSDSQWTAINN